MSFDESTVKDGHYHASVAISRTQGAKLQQAYLGITPEQYVERSVKRRLNPAIELGEE